MTAAEWAALARHAKPSAPSIRKLVESRRRKHKASERGVDGNLVAPRAAVVKTTNVPNSAKKRADPQQKG